MKRTITCLVALFFALNVNGQEKVYKVKVTTLFGDMIIKLHNDTPIHRDNFIKNVTNGWYDGTLFHRVIPTFMIQGGDPNSIGAEATTTLGVDRCKLLPAEIKPHHFHKKGAVAAARLPDNYNRERESSGCQFFIVQGYKHTDSQLDGMENENFKFSDVQRAYYKAVGGSAFLDNQYTVFGEVVEGLEIIDLIAAMRTSKNVKDRPNMDIPVKMTMVE